MATINVELDPLPIPSYVTVKQKPRERQLGMQDLNAIAISDLDEATIKELCHDLEVALLAKLKPITHSGFTG